MSVKIFYDEVNFRLQGWRKAVRLFKKVIGNEKKIPGDLTFIITSDSEEKKLNIEFLKHNYFTDVIAFDYSNEDKISGEIYISIDTVERNSNNYKVSLKEEVLRVMIHGLLHLCGYNDNSVKKRNEMRKMENIWLADYKESE